MQLFPLIQINDHFTNLPKTSAPRSPRFLPPPPLPISSHDDYQRTSTASMTQRPSRRSHSPPPPPAAVATHTGHCVCGLVACLAPGVQVHLEGRSGRMKSFGSREWVERLRCRWPFVSATMGDGFGDGGMGAMVLKSEPERGEKLPVTGLGEGEDSVICNFYTSVTRKK